LPGWLHKFYADRFRFLGNAKDNIMADAENPRAGVAEIIEHYNRYDESRRLQRDIGPFEFARTQELILRYLPPAPANVLDVGGGTGVYSFWLASLGYDVHLVDIVPRHIEQAAGQMRQTGAVQLRSARVGDALSLDFEDGSADAVILHGPLYHLSERKERLRALAEARRVLRPGGVLCAFAITRYAGLIYGLLQGHVFDDAYLKMICREVETGLRIDPPAWAFTFPNAYFHHPDELRAEVQGSGFQLDALLGVLGPAWMAPDLEQNWRDEERRAVLMRLAGLVENEPVLSPRLLAAARKA
jgi:ubiquinone/menaquinone biosynthesis C-methylase UbiE